MSAVCAESGLVGRERRQALLLSLFVVKQLLNAAEGDGHLGDVLEHVHLVCQTVFSLGVLETAGSTKLVVRVDEVVNQSRNVGTTISAEVGTTALEKSVVGGGELVLGTGGLVGTTDVVAEVGVEAGDDGGISTAGKSSNGTGEGKTAGDVGAGDDADETRGTAGGKSGDEGRVELGLRRAGETSEGCNSGDDGGGRDGTTHFDRVP